VFNLGMGEITVILLLALIFLGPKKLPDLAAGLGKLIREIRKATSDVKNEIALDDTFRKPFEELRDAVTLHPDELKRRDRIRKEIEETQRRAEEETRKAEAARAEAAAALAAPEAAGQPAPTPAHGVVPPPPIDAHVVPPPFPQATPPTGTVARSHTIRRMSPAGGTPAADDAQAPSHAPPPPVVSAGARVVPPISSGSGDRSNTTQFLTENDLMPSGPPQPPPTPKKS